MATKKESKFARNNSLQAELEASKARNTNIFEDHLVFKKKELKTRRVQLVLTPSLYEKVSMAASDLNMSLNEYIGIVLENATK